MRKLLVAVVVLLLLLVVGDRVAHSLAVNEAEKRLAAEGVTDPQVKISGFPFLTQVLSRTFKDVSVEAAAVNRDDVRAQQVTASATDVDVPKGGQVHVGSLTAHGTITYDEVLRQAGQQGLELSQASADEVRLRKSVTVLGQTLAIAARGRVEPDGRTIKIVPRGFELEGGGSVTPALASSLADNFTISYDVKALPDGMQIDQITPAANGFEVTLSGTDVTLSDAATALGVLR